MGEQIFDWREQYAPWIVLAVAFVAIDYFVITPQGIGFNTALVYGLSVLIVGEMLYLQNTQKSLNTFAMLLGAVIACFPILASLDVFTNQSGVYLAIIGIVLVYFLNKQESFGEYSEGAGYFTLVPMVVWILWGLLYLSRLADPTTQVPIAEFIYRGSILLFAGFSALRFLGIIKTSREFSDAKVAIGLVLLAALGMLLVTHQLGLPLAW